MKNILLLLAILLLTHSVEAQGQSFQIGPRIGFDLGDMEDLFIGADARIRTESIPVVINPGLDFYFTEENTSFFTLDVNGLFEFGIDNQSFTPYAGIGLIYSRWSTEFDSDIVDDVSDSDFGLNLVGGAVFGTRTFKPFAQAKIKLAGDFDLFSIGGGILFGL